jgi:hypothetical protein
MLWTIWIERNNKVFNYEHWHESKVKHRIWDELIIYAKAAWERVIKHIKISSFSTVAMLQGFDQTWGARNVLCRRNNLHIEWNWKRQHRWVVQLSAGSFFGGARVVLGRRGGGSPCHGGPGGLSMVGSVGVAFYMAVFHI